MLSLGRKICEVTNAMIEPKKRNVIAVVGKM
jgi:hypothetical protein